MINEKELETVKAHLLEKPFIYEEVFNEVVDHYATTYEQSEQSLDFVLCQLDREFDDKKIREINAGYLAELKRAVKRTHWSMFKKNFRWPQLMVTLLYLIPVTLLIPFAMEYRWLSRALFIAFVSIPMILGLFYYSRSTIRRWKSKTKHYNAHAEVWGSSLLFLVFYIQIPTLSSIIANDQYSVVEYHPLLTGLILSVGLISTVTAINFFNLKLKPNLNLSS